VTFIQGTCCPDQLSLACRSGFSRNTQLTERRL